MADAEERGGEGEEKKDVHVIEREREERERERERKREREKRSKQKPGALVNLMWRFLFFSHQSTSRNPRSRMKTKLRLRYLLSDSTSHVRLSFLVNWLGTRHDHGVHDCLPRRERQLVNLISDVETWTPTFPQRVNNRLASNRKDQVIECLLEQLLLRFKRKVGWRRHRQAQKFEAQEAQWKIKEFAGRQLQKVRGVRTHWKCMHMPR